MKTCPDCKAAIKSGATTCRCGWKAPSVAQHEVDALVRSEAHQRAEAHLAAQRKTEADAFMRAKGLHSADDCVELARTTVRRITCTGVDAGAHWRGVLANPRAGYYAKELAKAALAEIEGRSLERVPGEDDEAVPA